MGCNVGTVSPKPTGANMTYDHRTSNGTLVFLYKLGKKKKKNKSLITEDYIKKTFALSSESIPPPSVNHLLSFRVA